MILVYTGNGKGKTSACLGQVVRALGSGLRVAFAQFMKESGCAGEQRVLERLLGVDFLAGGRGFFRREEERPRHRSAAEQTLLWARRQLADHDMLILDESLYALRAGLLLREELESLLLEARERSCHVVLSGRNAPDWLLETADLVTSMEEIRHPWQKGLPAVPGVDF